MVSHFLISWSNIRRAYEVPERGQMGTWPRRQAEESGWNVSRSTTCSEQSDEQITIEQRYKEDANNNIKQGIQITMDYQLKEGTNNDGSTTKKIARITIEPQFEEDPTTI